MMELYRKEKANPLMGCLPMFLQIPVFLGLFHVLRRLDPAKPRTRPLYGWTADQFDSAVAARSSSPPRSPASSAPPPTSWPRSAPAAPR